MNSPSLDMTHAISRHAGLALRIARTLKIALSATLGIAALAAASAQAQQVQVPTLQLCNLTKMSASATVQIESRMDAVHSGKFGLKGELSCDPASSNPYPTGVLSIFGVSMSDSTVQGDIMFTTYEQFTSTGKHSPTAWLNGRCKVLSPAGVVPINGCHYWLMVANNNQNFMNGKTPDIVSFLVLDAKGNRIAYGTGPVIDGQVSVAPN